jgi:hypothetical protein
VRSRDGVGWPDAGEAGDMPPTLLPLQAWTSLGSDKARSVQARFLIAPVSTRACGFHRTRLSPFDPSPCSSCITKRSFPFPQHPQCLPRGQLARSLSPFVPVFSQARGLRRQASSWCPWLSHVQTPTPHPTPQEGIGISYGSRLPPSTCLGILPGVSRVHTVRLH